MPGTHRKFASQTQLYLDSWYLVQLASYFPDKKKRKTKIEVVWLCYVSELQAFWKITLQLHCLSLQIISNSPLGWGCRFLLNRYLIHNQFSLTLLVHVSSHFLFFLFSSPLFFPLLNLHYKLLQRSGVFCIYSVHISQGARFTLLHLRLKLPQVLNVKNIHNIDNFDKASWQAVQTWSHNVFCGELREKLIKIAVLASAQLLVKVPIHNVISRHFTH